MNGRSLTYVDRNSVELREQTRNWQHKRLARPMTTTIWRGGDDFSHTEDTDVCSWETDFGNTSFDSRHPFERGHSRNMSIVSSTQMETHSVDGPLRTEWKAGQSWYRTRMKKSQTTQGLWLRHVSTIGHVDDEKQWSNHLSFIVSPLYAGGAMSLHPQRLAY